MSSYGIIVENFMFLVLEVKNQVKLTRKLIHNYGVNLLHEIDSKDDYIDNLKTSVEDKCFSYIHFADQNDSYNLNAIRAIHIMSVNLERIADFCVNIARQIGYLNQVDIIKKYDNDKMFDVIQECFSQIITVFQEKDLAGALDICRVELRLDQMYKENFDHILAEMQQTDENQLRSAITRGLSQIFTVSQKRDIINTLNQVQDQVLEMDEVYRRASDRIMANIKIAYNTQDFITTIFILRYLERIGDAILNIGEALIFLIIGDRIKIRQFEALEKTLSESGFDGNITDIDFRTILGSRSGCHIGAIKSDGEHSHKGQGIFKEGLIKKIRKEKENIERWNQIYSGIAPRVYGYYERHNTGSLLVEFFPGCTIDEVIFSGEKEILLNALFIFENMVGEIWERTKKEKTARIDYIHQLKARLSSIKRVHPKYVRKQSELGNAKITSSTELLETCAAIEKKLNGPFRVFLHGDLNTNNLIYNHEEQKVTFIDLYRSKDGDYIQDASVFLVSNFRLPIFNLKGRDRLNAIIEHFYKFYIDFARKNNDATFEIRMALALVRSFYTSTRFEMNYEFAKEMYLRAIYLMEKIDSAKDEPYACFHLPEHLLYY